MMETGSNADGIGQLDLTLGSQTCGNHILGDPAGSVSGGTVDLAGILAAESTAAVTSVAAVGVNDNLAAGQAGVALRAAHNKAAGGVDVILGVLVQQLGGDDLLSMTSRRMSSCSCSWLTSGLC